MKISFSQSMVAIALGVALTFAACSNSPYPGYDATESGLYYQFFKQDEKAVKPQEGDMVRLVMSYKNSKDSVLFDSRAEDPMGRKPKDMYYIEFPLQKSTFKGSFEEALFMMGVGDSASFIISADSVYLVTFKAPKLPDYIEKGSMLLEKLEAIKKRFQEVELELSNADAMKDMKRFAQLNRRVNRRHHRLRNARTASDGCANRVGARQGRRASHAPGWPGCDRCSGDESVQHRVLEARRRDARKADREPRERTA